MERNGMSFLNGTTGSVLPNGTPRELHRIRQVRIKSGLTIEKVAADLGKSSAIVALEENPTSDLRISALREWSRALGVPVIDLLVERPEYVGIPGLTMHRLKQIESTAQKLVAVTTDKATLTFARGLCHQIREFFEDDATPLGDPGAALP